MVLQFDHTNRKSKMANANNLFSHYVLTDNATGTEYVEPFTASNVHAIVDGAAAALTDGRGLTYDQAARQVAIWNRSQAVHRQEFSYRLC